MAPRAGGAMMRPAPAWQVGLVRAWLAVSVLWAALCALELRRAGACSEEHGKYMRGFLEGAVAAPTDAGYDRAWAEGRIMSACADRTAAARQWVWLGPVLLAYALVAGVWTVRGFRGAVTD